jgi:hypothetical protein
MKISYIRRTKQIVIDGTSVLSSNYSYSLIKEAKAAVRYGYKPTNETLLGAIYLATKYKQIKHIWD